jgi:hypothetical protein
MVFQTTMNGVMDFHDGPPLVMGCVAPLRSLGVYYCFNTTPAPGNLRVEVMASMLDSIQVRIDLLHVHINFQAIEKYLSS